MTFGLANFFTPQVINNLCCVKISQQVIYFGLHDIIPALPSLKKSTGHKSHAPVLFACIPGLHGGQSSLAPDGGSFLALSTSSLQIFGSIHMYFTWVWGD